MKDALGHGSDARGGEAAHQDGIANVGRRMPPIGARDTAGHYVIPGGQGFDQSHAQNPLHNAAVAAGYAYSHSTPINMRDGSVEIHHTYAQGEHKIGVTGNKWSSQVSSASGHQTTGVGESSLSKHLSGKASRYPELRRKS